MQSIKGQMNDFLTRYGINPDRLDMETMCHMFQEEMQRGLHGSESSLAMLPTYLEAAREVPRHEKVIVLDAGGTNFRVATVYFDDAGQAVIGNFKKYPMPGIGEEVRKDEFFRVMAQYLEGNLEASSKIGFCFSYPVDMQPDKDGRVIKFSKEIKAPEVEGELVGENLKKALHQSGATLDYRVVLLNDTAAALLAGQAAATEEVFDSYIGFILGTGTNLCYIEANTNIGKKTGLNPEGSQLINVESGGFGKIPQGEIDLAFDRTTGNPGVFTFEKMISGRYLGGLGRVLLQTAAAEKLFSERVAASLVELQDLSTVEINQFLTAPFSGGTRLGAIVASGQEQDRTVAYYILDRLVDRAAKLSAVSIASAVIQSGKGLAPERPVCILAEGSTFHHLKSLKEKTEYYLQDYLVREKGRYYTIKTMENAPLIGAAIAGLTN
ncbi:MAG TPA: hexokinase [Bacillota bacterium]|nr:hexokinase [Bacillota bacterium]HPT87915.1 hexokinase [Bacillota bacterium]